MLIPIGNRLTVRKLENKHIINGISLSNSANGDNGVHLWGEIVALPENNSNPFLKGIKVGDKVLYKQFKVDSVFQPNEKEIFDVIEIEPENSVRQGQILAIERL